MSFSSQPSAETVKALVLRTNNCKFLKIPGRPADMSFSHEFGAVMRVNNHNLAGASAAGTSRTEETQRSEQAAGSRPGGLATGDDRVELSTALGSLSRALAAHQSDRSAKVQQLTALYQSGGYRPDAAGTSRAM